MGAGGQEGIACISNILRGIFKYMGKKQGPE